MKTILLFNSLFPDQRPQRLNVDDAVASAAVRTGIAAAANPAEAGALAAGGPLDASMLTEVVLQHGANNGALSRVLLPFSVVMVAANAGLAASIGKPVAVAPPAPVPFMSFANATASPSEGDSGTKIISNTINVARNGVTGPLTINLTYAGTATSGVDYVAGPASLALPDGVSSVSFDLAINGDTTVEPDETIIINAALAGYAAAASKIITIGNDDVNAGTVDVIYAAGSSNATSVVSDGTPGADPYTFIFSDGAFEPYNPGVNSGGYTSTSAHGSNFGPEAEFIRQYRAANGTKPLYLVKVTEGGTAFSPANTPNWNVATSGTGSLYRRLRDTALAAHAAIQAAGLTVNPYAMLWTHGGNDSNTLSTATASEGQLRDFIAGCRSTFMGNTAPFIVSAIRPAFSGYAYPYEVRTAQINVALADPTVLLVPFDGITQAGEQHPGNTGINDSGLIYWKAKIGTLGPKIETPKAGTVLENVAYSLPLRAMSICTYTIVGGADAAKFAISGGNLTMTAKDYEAPADAGADNTYEVTYRATQANGLYSESTHTVTVTNDAEGSQYDAGTDALIQAMNVKPTADEANRMDTFIRALRTAGIWETKIEGLQVYRHATSETDSKLDWRRPTRSAVIQGTGCTWDKTKGWTTPGTAASYISTGINPSASNVGLSSSNMCHGIGLPSHGSGSTTTGGIMGAGNQKLVFDFTAPSTSAHARMSGTIDATLAWTTGVGNLYLNRTSGAIQWAEGQGARTSVNQSTVALADTNITLGRYSSSTYGSGVFEFYLLATSLTITEQRAFDSAVAAYMAAA